jgi:hypothetical protein
MINGQSSDVLRLAAAGDTSPQRQVPFEHAGLANGIRRKDVFRRVLMTLRPGAFQAWIENGLNSVV